MKRRCTSVLLVLSVAAAAPVTAQQDPLLEGRLLRSAASLESRGNYGGAESVLRELLTERPSSTGGLFALERVLRAQGRLHEVLDPVDRFLEVEPTAAPPRILKMRVLSEADLLEALEAAARDWMDADPTSPDAYREVARAYQEPFGADRSLSVLLAGRAALADSAAFAMEVGDLHRDLGRPSEAVHEWSTAVGRDGAQVASVVRRLQDLEGDRAVLARPLVEALAKEPTTVARLRAGARIALDVGLRDEALGLARAVTPDLRGQTRRRFLADFARRAEQADAPTVALWAYRALREEASAGSEVRSLDQRIASTALQLGDTAAAIEAQRRVAGSMTRGSTERRRALAEVIRMVAARDPFEGRDLLAEFREEYAGAPELDPLAVALAAGFQATERPEEAERVLAGISGPRSALERGYLQLGQGQIDEGRTSLMDAVAGLGASDVTEVISLVALLDRTDGHVQTTVARAASLARQGRAGEAAELLEQGAADARKDARAALLALGARIADGGDLPAVAAGLRGRIAAEHGEAAEAPEAILQLARYLASDPEQRDGAVRLLEDLILERPGNPLVPAARRELQRIRAGTPK